MVRVKTLVLCLLVSSLFGYLEWGKEHAQFLCVIEWEILQKIATDPLSVLHPLVLLPMLGQLLLLAYLIIRKPNIWLLRIGIGSIAILIVLILIVGILAANLKIIISIVPFLILSFFTIRASKNLLSHL